MRITTIHEYIHSLTSTRPSKQHSNRLTKGHRIWWTQALIHQLSGQNHRVWALQHYLQPLRMQQEEVRQRTEARKRPSSSLVERIDRFESRSQLAQRDHHQAKSRQKGTTRRGPLWLDIWFRSCQQLGNQTPSCVQKFPDTERIEKWRSTNKWFLLV